MIIEPLMDRCSVDVCQENEDLFQRRRLVTRSHCDKVALRYRAAEALGFIQTHEQATELLTAMRNNQLEQRTRRGGVEM